MSFLEIEYREQQMTWNMAKLQSHDFYEIYYLLEGERTFFIKDKTFTLQKNSIVVISPFQMHKTEGGAYKRVNVYISADLLDENERKFLNACSSLIAFQLDPAKKNTFLALLKPFFTKASKDDSLKQKYTLAFAKALLCTLQSATLKPLSVSPKSPVQNDSKAVILQVVAYINQHFQEDISLDRLKDVFFLSKNTLCKNFQRVMNCSVMEYCSKVRLSKAKHLLLTTDKSMEDIADLCGYSSANYFSLLFKSKTGIAPSHYRKKK
ncbi:MAG: helix-turn-helix domain-containing protein [Clostridiales bacterium]|nr:helix-turn-helix domain-containing protein [Clostridiales bacterium]